MAEKSYDDSYIEKKYFIDAYKYNCPYCNIRNISYKVSDYGRFDWSRERVCYFYIIKCSHCESLSLHLSYYNLVIHNYHFISPLKETIEEDDTEYEMEIQKRGKTIELDEAFFHHQPTTFFTVDSRIPETIRKLISEADGCRKMNYLVGASGCLRKAIYELLRLQKIPKAEKDKILRYENRIKKLKEKFTNIDPDYFDTLATIQDMTSDTLHEDSWKSYDSSTLQVFLETTKEILYEIYVLPKVKEGKKTFIQKLKVQYTKDKSNKVKEQKTEEKTEAK